MKMILTLFPRVEIRARLEQFKGRIQQISLPKRRQMISDDRALDRPQFRTNPFVFKRRPNPP